VVIKDQIYLTLKKLDSSKCTKELLFPWQQDQISLPPHKGSTVHYCCFSNLLKNCPNGCMSFSCLFFRIFKVLKSLKLHEVLKVIADGLVSHYKYH
jgi:hypothetical protein